LFALTLSAEARTWTAKTGQTIDGEFVKLEGDTVSIKLPNGSTAQIKLDMLSDADQKFVNEKNDPFKVVDTPKIVDTPKVADTPKDERKAGERMTLTIKGVEYAFRWCPPGTFMMGSPADEKGRDWYTTPILQVIRNPEVQRQVTLSRGFWMLETEVTQEMWTSTGTNPTLRMRFTEDNKGNKLPVSGVSWNDCQEYIKKLNDLRVAPAGWKFSLPTEAQWEYACRAGTTTAYHFGDTLKPDQAHYFLGSGDDIGDTFEAFVAFKMSSFMESSSAESRNPVKVGSYPANAWGLHDMHGNVQEWCLDYYGPYQGNAVTDPIGILADSPKEMQMDMSVMIGTLPKEDQATWSEILGGTSMMTIPGPFVVSRGGSYEDEARLCRSASRTGGTKDSRCLEGLRLALIRAE